MKALSLRPGPYLGFESRRTELWTALCFAPFLWLVSTNPWPCLALVGALACNFFVPRRGPKYSWLSGAMMGIVVLGTAAGYSAYACLILAALCASKTRCLRRQPFIPAMIVALLATNLESLLGVTFLIHPAPKLLYLTMAPATLLAFARTKPFFSLFSPLTLCVLWVLAALTKSELTNQNFDPNLFFWWTPLLFLATESSWPTSSKWGLAAVWTIIALTGLSQLANDDFKPIGLAMLAGFEIHLQLRGLKRRRTLLDSLPPKRITENPKMVAVRLCAKKPDSLEIISRFHGVENCRLSHHLDRGRFSCPHACLGFGDCKLACPFGAIGPSKQAGEPPALYPRLCRGCGSCVAACPQAIMVLREVGSKFLVQCSGTAFIKQMDRLCPVGCLGCSRCRKACPAGAVSRRGHQAPPQVDEEKCAAHWPQCGQACRASCPRDLPKFVSQAQGEKSQEDMNRGDEPTNG